MAVVRINSNDIVDWNSFHRIFQNAFGFPDGYGMNRDAWIDCMSYLRDAGAKMSSLVLKKDEILNLEILESKDFQTRMPEIFKAFVECAAAVNQRFVRYDGCPGIALVFL
jgi:RNAse (barnase) inhibitor barstar